MERNPTYTTDDEIEFIRGLGKGIYVPLGRGVCDKHRRVVLLQKYVESIEKRFRWGDIDKKKTKEYAMRALGRAKREYAKIEGRV